MWYKLSDLFDLQMGKTPSRNNPNYWNSNDYLWVSISDMSGYDKYVSSTKEYISELAVKESGIKTIPANTVIMSFKLSIGKTAITTDSIFSNEAIMAFIDKKTTAIDPEYIFYLFSGKDWDEGSNKAVMGKTLNKVTLSNIEVDIPSLDIQKERVDKLNKISTLIANKKQHLNQLDELVKARFVEMFGDFDLAPQCNEWIELSKLGEIVSGSTPKTGTAEYWDGDICWITPAELNSMSGIVYDSKKKITEAGRNSCSLRLMPINTVILSSRAPIGKVAILGKEMCCNQGFKNIICNEKILPKYLYYLLAYNTDYLNSLGRGATFKEISKKIVEDIRISLPSIEQQAKFITFSEQVDKSKFTLQNSIISLMNLWYNINQYVCERMYGEA